MKDNLFNHINIQIENTHIPNGHIGFNEPSDVFEPMAHRVKLNERTIADNARFFESIDKVPPEVQASIFQFHKNVTIILDEAAASELEI